MAIVRNWYHILLLYKDTLVGRHVKDGEDIIRFDLLTPEEEKVIIPKLEAMCQEDLEANGLSFSNNELKL